MTSWILLLVNHIRLWIEATDDLRHHVYLVYHSSNMFPPQYILKNV